MQSIIIVHWSKSTGPEPIIQYPPESKKFPSKELILKIWALHELDKESSIIEFIPEGEQEQYISIIQKFEGEIYFLILVYNQEDIVGKNIKDNSDILAIVSKNLIELVNTDKITRAISEAFYTIRDYSKLEKEENLLNFFKNKIKYTILQILRNGVISKDELNNLLRKEYGFSTINIDLLLISFIRENLIVKQCVPGSDDCYLLIKDLAYTRIPPVDFSSKPQIEDEITEDYQEKLINFYSNYNCASEIENKTIINFLMNKDNYRLLRKLREKSLSVSDCIDLLNNKEDQFNELLEKEFIYEAKGKVLLFSDIRIIKFTPFYIIESLSKRYKNRQISINEYITHLKILTEKYNLEQSLIDYEII